VLPGGALDLFGDARTSWVHLEGTREIGASTITLERTTDWRPGDRIVIAPSSTMQADAELRTVKRVSGATLDLDAPLAAIHYGRRVAFGGRVVDLRAEVALLTRNIVIRGDSASEIAGHGGHVMVLAGGAAHLDGVELYRMGQKGVLARYAFHWHMAAHVPGQFVRRSSVWHSFNRCFTIHGTHDALLEDNVCYDHVGHGYFMEDGIETGNTLRHNLGLLSHPGTLIPSDKLPATFWITNPDNTYEHNVSAGSRAFGFWLSPPLHPTGASSTEHVWPSRTPLRQFDGNVSHSSEGDGIRVESDPSTFGSYNMDYRPRAGGDPNGAPATSVFSNLTVYRAGRGFWERGDHMRVEDGAFVGNYVGVHIGDAGLTAEGAVTRTLIAGGSDLPASPNVPPPRSGYLIYDGNVELSDVTFANFSGKSWALEAPDGFDGRMSARNGGRGIRFVNVPDDAKLHLALAPVRDGERQATFLDLDGSLSGVANTMIVSSKNPFALDESCTPLTASWNAAACRSRYVSLRLVNGARVGPATVTRDDAVSSRFDGYTADNLAITVPVGHTYTFRPDAGALPFLSVETDGLRAGDAVTAVVPWNAADVRALVPSERWAPVRRVSSRRELDQCETDAVWLDSSARQVHVRVIGTASQVEKLIVLQTP
jgi:cell migration-inducing and hyaluronan-binding protein